jgi:TonB family protein
VVPSAAESRLDGGPEAALPDSAAGTTASSERSSAVAEGDRALGGDASAGTAPAIEAVDHAQPRKISGESPDYPEPARAIGLEGEIVAQVEVLQNGRVGRVEIERGLSASLDREVVETLQRWRFQPATRSGAAIDSTYRARFDFGLDGLPKAADSSAPGVLPPRRLTVVPPEYTDEARGAGTEGKIVADLFIDANGVVQAVSIVSGLPAGLNESAARAARQWRYSPATRSGSPIAVRHRVAIAFELD